MSNKGGLVVFLVFFILVKCESVPEIPKFLKICHRNDPNLNECILRSIESLRPYLKAGIQELNVPPCEPLLIPRIELTQSAGPVSAKSFYSNCRVFGGTDYIIKAVRVDLENDRMRLKLNIPRLQMTSDYTMSGKILMLPINGKGTSYGNYTDIEVVAMMQGERYRDTQTNRIHYRAADIIVNFQVGNASIYLDNLFNGDETLAAAINAFLNENWKTVAGEIKPTLEINISKMFKNFANKLFSKYPFDVLLPP